MSKMLNSTETSGTPKLRKKKIEDAVLKKSKRFVKESQGQDSQDADSSNLVSNPTTEESVQEFDPIPSSSDVTESRAAKKRKPRHESEEGKKFLKAKARKRAIEEVGSCFALPTNQNLTPKGKRPSSDNQNNDNSQEEPPKKKSKKNKKKRKKKGAEAPTSNLKEKRPETEERQRNESLAYLQLWCKHREHWKFEKLKQMWLLKHAISVKDVDDKVFEILVDYISSAKGAAKVKTLQEMQEVMAGFEKKYGRQGGSAKNSVFSVLTPEKSFEEAGEDETKEYDRAREIVKILSNN